MRVQLQGQALRLRINEAELDDLLVGEPVTNVTRLPDGQVSQQRLVLGQQIGWHNKTSGWRVTLPEDAVRELAGRLPSRDGLHVELPVPGGAALEVRFDVDVRDSTHRRFPGKGSGKRDAGK